MSKKKILVQVDPDENACVFDSVVAIDSEIDQLIVQSNIRPEQVTPIIHGAIFTRGMEDLKSTAVFFGGCNVAKTEALVQAAKESFFGPLKVSIMSDPNGCNTTAAAAVLSAGKHTQWKDVTVTVLAATGPVGSRIAKLIGGLAVDGVQVRVCSRKLERAKSLADDLSAEFNSGKCEFITCETGDDAGALASIDGANVVFAAGAAGVGLLPQSWESGLQKENRLPSILIDLNAVPPSGIPGVEPMDKSKSLFDQQTIAYGAIGVGGLKMKIHKQCIRSLFETNDRVLEVQEIYDVGATLIQTA